MPDLVLGSTTIVSESNGEISSTFFGLKSMQSFTSTGTYTKPAHINTIRVFITGAGASGGAGSGSWNNGGGGGAGGTAIKLIDVSGLATGATIAVTIGTGGAATTVNGQEGNGGGTSSFGSYCSATGGEAGGAAWSTTTDNGQKGNGGTGVDGDINLIGGDGGASGGGQIHDESGSGAIGGASYWGGGGQNGAQVSTVNSSNYTGKVGKAFGSGGGGGDEHGGTHYSGGAGKDGFCLVEEYV